MKDKNESFNSIYKPVFDQENDEWILLVPKTKVKMKSKDFYEIRLPVYSGRALAISGNILRPLRKQYRNWLLKTQKGECPVCHEGDKPGDPWNLDHRPALCKPGSRFIDYAKVTNNRVIHQKCDPDQNRKNKPD